MLGQSTDLDKLSDTWSRARDLREYEEGLQTGFVERAELLNGRTAMFFLVVGLLTEGCGRECSPKPAPKQSRELYYSVRV